MGVQRFNLSGTGLNRVLGELEAGIMEAVWRAGTATGAEICAAVGQGPHYKTVLTVANRLVSKELLVRARSGDRAYAYRAAVDRDIFLNQVTASVASGLIGDFGQQALAQLVQAADDVDPAYLDELERLIREQKGNR